MLMPRHAASLTVTAASFPKDLVSKTIQSVVVVLVVPPLKMPSSTC